jgi:hypothetical protein
LIAPFGPKSVSGTQFGPRGLRVRKFVVRHTPPLAPAAYTVFPDGSLGSTAIAPTRPTVPVPPFPVGPTGVQLFRVVASVPFDWKMWNPADVWSETGSPRPFVSACLSNVSSNFLMRPVSVPLFRMTSCHAPLLGVLMSWDRAWTGL